MRKPVLLIDDSATIQKIVDLTIDQQHFELISAYSIEEGLNKCKEFSIASIIIDGDLLRNSSKHDVLSLFANDGGVKILVIGEDDAEYPEAAGYLPKPFSATKLNSALKEIAGIQGSSPGVSGKISMIEKVVNTDLSSLGGEEDTLPDELAIEEEALEEKASPDEETEMMDEDAEAERMMLEAMENEASEEETAVVDEDAEAERVMLEAMENEVSDEEISPVRESDIFVLIDEDGDGNILDETEEPAANIDDEFDVDFESLEAVAEGLEDEPAPASLPEDEYDIPELEESGIEESSSDAGTDNIEESPVAEDEPVIIDDTDELITEIKLDIDDLQENLPEGDTLDEEELLDGSGKDFMDAAAEISETDMAEALADLPDEDTSILDEASDIMEDTLEVAESNIEAAEYSVDIDEDTSSALDDSAETFDLPQELEAAELNSDLGEPDMLSAHEAVAGDLVPVDEEFTTSVDDEASLVAGGEGPGADMQALFDELQPAGDDEPQPEARVDEPQIELSGLVMDEQSGAVEYIDLTDDEDILDIESASIELDIPGELTTEPTAQMLDGDVDYSELSSVPLEEPLPQVEKYSIPEEVDASVPDEPQQPLTNREKLINIYNLFGDLKEDLLKYRDGEAVKDLSEIYTMLYNATRGEKEADDLDVLRKEFAARDELNGIFDEMKSEYDTAEHTKAAAPEENAGKVEESKEPVSTGEYELLSAIAEKMKRPENTPRVNQPQSASAEPEATLTVKLTKNDLAQLFKSDQSYLGNTVKDAIQQAIEEAARELLPKLTEKLIRQELDILKNNKK